MRPTAGRIRDRPDRRPAEGRSCLAGRSRAGGTRRHPARCRHRPRPDAGTRWADRPKTGAGRGVRVAHPPVAWRERLEPERRPEDTGGPGDEAVGRVPGHVPDRGRAEPRRRWRLTTRRLLRSMCASYLSFLFAGSGLSAGSRPACPCFRRPGSRFVISGTRRPARSCGGRFQKSVLVLNDLGV